MIDAEATIWKYVQGRPSLGLPDISHIIGNLYMGGVGYGEDLPTEIKHVISIQPSGNYKLHSGVLSDRNIVMMDDEYQGFDQVDSVASWVNDCRQRQPTFVHCAAGLNRSGLIVARALMLDGWSAEDAIKFLREKRSQFVLCNPHFERWLLNTPA